jgi:hypothetical protein
MSDTSTDQDAVILRRVYKFIALIKYVPVSRLPFLIGIRDLLVPLPFAEKINDMWSADDECRIDRTFDEAFPDTTFAMIGDEVVPTAGDSNVVHVKPWVEQEIRRIEDQIAALQHEKNSLKRWSRDWSQYEFPEKMASMSPLQRSLKLIKEKFHCKTNRDLSADGGDTNAELRKGSIARLCDFLQEHIGIDSTDTIMDGGSAYNYTVAMMAQYLDVKVVGVEYVENRVYLGAISHLNMLDEIESERNRWWLPSSFNRHIAFAHMDLMTMESFDCVTILYLFDEGTLDMHVLTLVKCFVWSNLHRPHHCFSYLLPTAFDGGLIEHIWRAVGKSPRIRAVISFKASKESTYHDCVYEWSGFERLEESVPTNKTGSGEGNTAYVYTRGGVTKPDHSPPLDPESLDASIKDFYKDKVSKVWNESIEKAREVYTDIQMKTQLGNNQGIVTRGQKRQATELQATQNATNEM